MPLQNSLYIQVIFKSLRDPDNTSIRDLKVWMGYPTQPHCSSNNSYPEKHKKQFKMQLHSGSNKYIFSLSGIIFFCQSDGASIF